MFQTSRAGLSCTSDVFDVEKQKDMQNSRKRKEIIAQTYEKAKAMGDNNVYFLDGETLFGKEDEENCTVDGCHPNDLGFYRMAKGIYKKIQEIDKNFGSEQ